MNNCIYKVLLIISLIVGILSNVFYHNIKDEFYMKNSECISYNYETKKITYNDLVSYMYSKDELKLININDNSEDFNLKVSFDNIDEAQSFFIDLKEKKWLCMIKSLIINNNQNKNKIEVEFVVLKAK